MGFIKTGFKELSLSLKNNFLQRKSLKQTNKQTEKTKKAKHNKGKTQQRKIKEEKKKQNILCKNFYHNGPMEFQSYLFHFILMLFLSFYGTGYSV